MDAEAAVAAGMGADVSTGGSIGGSWLAHVVDGVTVHDAGGYYLDVSASYEGLVGYRRDELVGRSPFELGLFHPDDVDEIGVAQARGLQAGGPIRVTYRLRRRDDTYIWVESTARTVETTDGERFLVSTREASDIRSLIRSVELERELSARLEDLGARQRAFINAMNHRARTPVTRVLGYARLLEQAGDALDDQQRASFHRRLVETAMELRQLVEQMTEAGDLTRAETVVQRRVVDVGQLVVEVLAERVASDRAVTVEIPARTRARVDPAKLRAAFEMLLSNAFVHTPIGTQVWVRVAPDADGLHLVVEDEGPGVPDEVAGRIFEAFERGEPDEADPGAGLGLYIVAEVAALHGGHAWVENRAEGGAAFHLHLPERTSSETQRVSTDLVVEGVEETAADVATEGKAGAVVSELSRESRRVVASLLESARSGLDMEVAYLSVFVGEDQLIVAVEGDGRPLGVTRGRRIPLEETFCLRMIQGEVRSAIGDTAVEPALSGLGASERIASYVGVPVHHPDGQVIGTLCCADTTPRDQLPPTTVETLSALSRLITQRLLPSVGDDELAAATERISQVLVRPDAPAIVHQPIVDLRTGRIAGYQALSRFGDDRPVELWFADAARVGLLVELESKAVRQATRAFAEMAGLRFLSLKLSPQSIVGSDLAVLLAGLAPERVVLGVTERAAIEDYQSLHEVLRPWRERGLRLAIDDVGGGLSSLRHVVQLRPDIIKIDRSLIRDIGTDPSQRAVAAAVRTLATDLDATVVAAGLETPAALRALAQVGIDYAQGWLLASPDDGILSELPADVRRRILDARAG